MVGLECKCYRRLEIGEISKIWSNLGKFYEESVF